MKAPQMIFGAATQSICKISTNSDSFYSEFAGTTELGEHSGVLQLSIYFIIHALS